QSRHENGARRRAHDRAGVVIGEGDTGLLEPVVGGQGKACGPLRRESLLVREDEEDVQTPPVAVRCQAVFLSFGFRPRNRGDEKRGGQGTGRQAVELTPREITLSGYAIHPDSSTRSKYHTPRSGRHSLGRPKP